MTKKRKFPKDATCKPCWELKYCPYDSLTEHFPLYHGDDDLNEINELYHDVLQELMSPNQKTEHEIYECIRRLFMLYPPHYEFLLKHFEPEDVNCRLCGHTCPVFLIKGLASETKEERRQGRYIPRDVMLKVVRRDNHICQECFQYVNDNEIEFDHIIPYSKGGPTNVENIRLLCRKCNRKKSNSLDKLLF
jgi:hypothetical protein